jgi:outer membrane receptor protein involved in Fe transport
MSRRRVRPATPPRNPPAIRLLAALALVSIGALPVRAERSGAPGSAASVDEIVVVAQKRVEDIQDVPISITTLTAPFIEESGLTNILDASRYAPNVQINAVLEARTTAVRIRGIGNDGFNAGIDPSVAGGHLLTWPSTSTPRGTGTWGSSGSARIGSSPRRSARAAVKGPPRTFEVTLRYRF